MLNSINDLYNKIKEFVINNQKVSESLLMRTFDIDYKTATIVTERLYSEGVISKKTGYKPRTVLIKN